MTDPKETNEELSTEELKSVNGGVTHNSGYWGGDIPSVRPIISPHGSGFGGTREDWEKIKGEKSKFKGSYIR